MVWYGMVHGSTMIWSCDDLGALERWNGGMGKEMKMERGIY